MKRSAKAAATEDPIIPQSTQLVKSEEANGGLPALPSDLEGFTGLEGISQDTWIIPRMKIVQPTSREGTAGKLAMNLTGDEFDSLPIVVIKATQGRILWDKKNPGNDKALCRSYDFMKPDSSIERPPSPICARHVMGTNKKQILKTVCPKGQWHGEEPPECSETFNLLCLLVDDFLPFWITLHGTSIQPVRRYLSAIALRRCPLWQYEATLSTEQQINDKGKFFVARFSSTRPISKELEAQIAEIVAGLKDADIKRTFEAEEEAMEGEDGTPQGEPPTTEWGPDLDGADVGAGEVNEMPDWMTEEAR